MNFFAETVETGRGIVATYRYSFKGKKLKALSKYISLILFFSLILVIGKLSGWQVYLVSGSSMNPAIPKNSLLLIREVEPSTIKLNQIILYKEDGMQTKVAHRVVGIKRVNNKLYFRTKGDANRQIDFKEIPASHVLGVVKYTSTLPLPLANSISKLYGFRHFSLILLFSLVFILFFSEIMEILKGEG
jgi:signal peptidase I